MDLGVKKEGTGRSTTSEVQGRSLGRGCGGTKSPVAEVALVKYNDILRKLAVPKAFL